ncbi:MAG TPA: MnhB domain-containing protein [Devosia sp.]|jgi:multicomponent Na+:H+ antiporter subunit B|nr:MnhB domain-containing protein [Devosia sp.]
MNSLILRTAAPFIVTVMVLFSLAVLLRGHNHPGGGFIGGLIAAAAVAVYGMSHGEAAVRRLLRVDALAWAGIGLLLALASGLVSAVTDDPFLTGHWLPGNLFGTPGLFDIGVYLIVFGALSAILLALEDGEGEA